MGQPYPMECRVKAVKAVVDRGAEIAEVARILHIGICDDSPLNEPSIDTELRDEQIDSVYPWVPTAAIRFSRAF